MSRLSPAAENPTQRQQVPEPIILSTWRFGQQANAAGWPCLTGERPSALDAAEQACRAVEANPEVTSVGLGGYPDQSGEVTLDASIMLSPAHCGSVCFVRRFLHPVSIARLVMEKSPHTMLAGDGAERFAAGHGQEPTDLLTDLAREAWQKWLVEQHSDRSPSEFHPGNQFHDTVGVLALDASGLLAGACSTSGTPMKLPGRVGDSPIIGHGLYVDPRYGAAVATGLGELITGVCGSFLAVELMRRGASPLDAAVGMLQRIIDNYSLCDEHQVGVITLNPTGQWSSAALRPGYYTAVRTVGRDDVIEPDRVILP